MASDFLLRVGQEGGEFVASCQAITRSGSWLPDRLGLATTGRGSTAAAAMVAALARVQVPEVSSDGR